MRKEENIMDRNKKRRLIFLLKQYKQYINQSNTADIQKEIQNYVNLMKQVDEMTSSIQDVLDEIKTLQKSARSSFRKVQKQMEQFDKDRVVADKWVASLKEVARYKRIQADYKEIYETSLTKVNTATRNVLIGLKEANEDAKRAMTKIELEIIEQGVFDIIKNMLSKFGRFIKSMFLFKRTVNSLPKIRSGYEKKRS